MKHNIQLYVKQISNIEPDGDDEMRVDLDDVDLDQFVAEFNQEALLECIDFGTITDYVARVQKDNDEYEE